MGLGFRGGFPQTKRECRCAAVGLAGPMLEGLDPTYIQDEPGGFRVQGVGVRDPPYTLKQWNMVPN